MCENWNSEYKTFCTCVVGIGFEGVQPGACTEKLRIFLRFQQPKQVGFVNFLLAPFFPGAANSASSAVTCCSIAGV